MRIVFLFLLVFSMNTLFAQQKEGVIKVRKKLSTTPTIAGVAGGDIDAGLLCADEGIVINKNVKVISFVFKVDYGSKEVSIKNSGNVLNRESCNLIAMLTTGAEVYINEIAIQDNKGRESITTPMRFRIK